MKSKKGKEKKEIIQENKKPPGKQGDEKEKDKENNIQQPQISPEEEKKMYEEGQEHIEELPKNPEESKETDENQKEAPKKQVLIKPRETYLQDKISKLNPNKNLMSNIKKELGEKVKTLIKEEKIVINNVPKDSDIIRYGYMEWDWYNTERFDNTNELFYKDNENNDFRYYGNQCYGLMNRKTMKIYLDSCNYCFNGNEDVENIHRGNKFNLNIYYATKPIFLDHIAYHEYYLNDNTNQAYILPYSINLINKYEFIE